MSDGGTGSAGTEQSEESQQTLTDEQRAEWEKLRDKPPEDLTDAEKTSKIKLSVRRRFDPPEWALAFELSSPDGRRADAIAVNTFPSRNFKVVGFEFKASRSDWLAEKREGEKADYFVTACDEWYVVAWSGVVEESELPEGWGLLELKPNSEQLWKQVESDLTERQQGEPDRPFWGRFLQKTVGDESNYTKQDLKEARKRGYEEGREDGKEYATGVESRRIERKAEKWDELQDAGLDWLSRVSDDRIRELKDSREFLRALEDEGYRTLWGEYEDLYNAVVKIQAPLERLESFANGEDESNSVGGTERDTDA